MKLGVNLIGLAIAAALAACAPQPPVEVDASKVEPTLYWSTALQGKRIAIEGYINFDNGRDGREIAPGPELRSNPYGGGDKLIRFAADFGSGPNQIGSPNMSKKTLMEEGKIIPDVYAFDPNNLTYQDSTGSPHPIHHRVRVVGRLGYGTSLEKDPRSPRGVRFTPFLNQVVLEAPPGS